MTTGRRRNTLSEFSELYFPYAEVNLAPSTVIIYRGTLKEFIRLIGERAKTLPPGRWQRWASLHLFS